MPLRNLIFAFLMVLGTTPAIAADTLRLYFPSGVSELQKSSMKTLDSGIYFRIFSTKSAIEILGYTDFVGSSLSNETLSAARAEAVKTYLLQNGFSGQQMIRTSAKGELPAGSGFPRNGIAAHRRVDVIVGGKKAQDAVLREAQMPVESPASPDYAPKEEEPTSVFIQPSAKTLSTASVGLAEIIAQTPVGSSFRLSKIFFPAGRHVIYDSSRAELQDLLRVLQEQPKIKIRVEGHVCCIDTNMAKDALDEQTIQYRLSINRARFVAQYLVKSGISNKRISYVGLGKRFPIVAYESTPEEAAANRRVEIRILEK